MKYSYFEDLPVWQKARQFVSNIYKLTSRDTFKKDYDLVRQLKRACSSIVLNVSEGFERKTNLDFARFINQAKASSGECRAILYIALDLNYISDSEFEENIKIAKNLSYQLAALEKYLIQTSKK